MEASSVTIKPEPNSYSYLNTLNCSKLVLDLRHVEVEGVGPAIDLPGKGFDSY